MPSDTASGTVRDDRDRSRIHRLEFDVPWPPKHVAAYLLEGPEPILIDAGAPADAGRAELLDGLESIGYAPSDVAHVVVTHVHSDHVGQLPALREAGATVHVPWTDRSRLERDPAAARDRLRETARSAGFRGDDREEVVESDLESLRRDRRLTDPETPEPIDPATPLTVGGREFEVLETPGHEIDHLCFETTVAGRPVLFAGDALVEPFRAGAFQVGFDRGAYGAIDAYYEAMDRLSEASAVRAYPGHGPAFEDPQRVVETTRDRLDTLLVDTRSALAAIEPATPVSITERRVGDVPYHAPVLDTLGALGTLADRGVVTYGTEAGVRYYETA